MMFDSSLIRGDQFLQLEVVVEAGFNHISIGGPLGHDPAEAMRLIAQRVIPHFRSTAANT